MRFNQLRETIEKTHQIFRQEAGKAINVALTLRNCLIGGYIVNYEQNGEDRAQYGQKLLENLANELSEPSLSFRNLRLYRQFYQTYPQIWQSLIAKLHNTDNEGLTIWQSLIAKFNLIDPGKENVLIIPDTKEANSEIRQGVPPHILINRLSFTHLVQLLPVDDFLKRTFYEIECIKGNWSVRELKRQIGSLYFERSGFSRKPELLSKLTLENSEPAQPAEAIKSVYAFEFLGLNTRDIVEEKDLEAALLNHLQEFLLELGHGFCFEARQKRILIDDEYYFVDLVFYHRILKCHVLIELKLDIFRHDHLSQLNTYVAYYREEVMQADDNPPVGILLCTEKGKKLVEYALSGMDEKLFVSKYLVELPSKKQLENFILTELQKLT